MSHHRSFPLISAPPEKKLRIVEVLGGHGLRKRLFDLGFHKGDEIILDARGLLQGPILVRNVSSDTVVAIGRGIAQKIMVEIVSDEE
ncbi:ferrous iron transport protein A [Candidatus Aminicenantes bacterium AC-334-K16]|jgi:ferrous iron transport protein A|nr:ferrous iron transport protein A [Candidatus Aminicenantes bacterium AC-334-K16]